MHPQVFLLVAFGTTNISGLEHASLLFSHLMHLHVVENLEDYLTIVFDEEINLERSVLSWEVHVVMKL